MNISQSSNTGLTQLAQKKKDSVQAVLIQLYTNYNSSRGSVTKNSVNDVHKVQYFLSSAGGWDLNRINNIYSVDCLVFRCLRLISAFAEVTKNPAVLSPSSFNFSISSITSWGIRTVVICDFAFFTPFAITNTPCFWCISVYAKKIRLKALKCISLGDSFKSIGEIHLRKQNPVDAENTYRASNHNVNRSNIMAIYKSTQTHPKFIQHQSGKFFPHHSAKFLAQYKPVKNNLPLLVEFSYIDFAPYKTGVRFSSLNISAGSRLDSDMRYFCARKPTHTRIMAGRDGEASAPAGSRNASLLTPLRLATPFSSEVARLLKSISGASIMASSAYPKFLWRFFSCQQSKYFTVEATSEQEARSMLPDAPCLFSARIRQGG